MWDYKRQHWFRQDDKYDGVILYKLSARYSYFLNKIGTNAISQNQSLGIEVNILLKTKQQTQDGVTYTKTHISKLKYNLAIISALPEINLKSVS